MGGDMPTVEQLTTALGDDANLSGIVSTEGGGYVTLLSQQEQSAYDRAVKMGNGVAARHYAIINASRVKRLLDKGIEGLNEGEIEKLGLKKPKPVVDPVIVPEPEGGGNGGSGSEDNQSTAADILEQLQEDKPNIIASSSTPGETEANISQLETALSASSQNPSGQISLKDGGLASKPKKKKNKK